MIRKRERQDKEYNKLEVNRNLRLLPTYVCLIEFACEQGLGLQSEGRNYVE